MQLTVYLEHLHAVAVIHGVRNFPDAARAAFFARSLLPKWVGPWFVVDARATRNLDEMRFHLLISIVR